MAAQSESEIQHLDLHNFTFENGTTLPIARLAYQDLNPTFSKVVLIPTCFQDRIKTTLTHVNGALRDYRIIVVALFGNGESSSPSNTPNFPSSIDYRDCVRAQYELLTKHLGIQSLDVMLGFSMGGQCTYYMASMYPTFVRNAIIVCSAARTSRHNYQFLEGPRAALENSVDYPTRADHATKKAPKGLEAFGKAFSAWITSPEWYEEEKFKELGSDSLESWNLEVSENDFDGWDPDDLLSKLRMWQNGDISVCQARENGSFETAMARIEARVLLMPCQTDQYFSWKISEKEVKLLKNGTLKVIPSIWGHIAGGGTNEKDTTWMSQTITEFLK